MEEPIMGLRQELLPGIPPEEDKNFISDLLDQIENAIEKKWIAAI